MNTVETTVYEQTAPPNSGITANGDHLNAPAAAPPTPGGPIQLIRIDERGRCEPLPEGLEILNALTASKLAVIGIAGLYRTGKSFLLNRLLGLQAGFEIGPTVNPCTKGVWMWGQPVQLAPDYHCILLDTEGLGSTQRSASIDLQIFSLCILLSSSFIYNSLGPIDEEAIDSLHLVLNISQRIQARAGKGGGSSSFASSGGTEETPKSTVSGVASSGDSTTSSSTAAHQKLAQYFPSLLWVCRDFHLQLIDESGQQISPDDYLEAALAAAPPSSTGANPALLKKNKIRELVKLLFRERHVGTELVDRVSTVSGEGWLGFVNELRSSDIPTSWDQVSTSCDQMFQRVAREVPVVDTTFAFRLGRST